MVRRRAIGATVAAILVFSTLMLTNLTLLTGAAQRERLSLTADSESLLTDTAVVIGGTAGLGLLDDLQSYISSRSFQCPSAVQDIDNYTATLTATRSQDGVTVDELLSPGGGQTEPDNFTILKPFNGSSPGEIDLALQVRWSGMSALKDVSYSKTESHHLHLPVMLSQMVAFCESSVEEVGSLLKGQVFAYCDSSKIGPPLAVLDSILQGQASARGLSYYLDYNVDNSDGCRVAFACVVEQLDAVGPAGAFSVRLGQGETVAVRVGG
ncbi:MAG TPA: hypothetical protein VKF39_05165 [Nitrososphaerales archaeon]|nr:hypothetical protein [Nitrososphaerales archaeon]